MRAAVVEDDADAVALRAPQCRAGDLPVVGPRREEYAGRNLDLGVQRDQLVFAQRLARRQRAHHAVVEMGQEPDRVEAARPQ